ncbi:MAG TPA: signal peptidase I [Ktedonobacterales bacterium]|jgi:signal peptidase I
MAGETTSNRKDYAYEDEQGEHWGARLLREVLEVAIITLLLFMGVRLLVQNYEVLGPSMTPTLLTHQRILVDKAHYFFTSPARGDIVVFQAPQVALDKCPGDADTGQPNTDFVKRIIGVPGDTVQIDDNGAVIVDGVPIKESYVRYPAYASAPEKVQLGPNEYFVMGDNRENSCDSRIFGPVQRNEIAGRAAFVYWPLTNLHGVADVSSIFANIHP